MIVYKLRHKKLGLFYKDSDSYESSFSKKGGKVFKRLPKPFSSPFLLISKKQFRKTGLDFEKCKFVNSSSYYGMFEVYAKKSHWEVVSYKLEEL